jgi:hypothetical protein
VARAKRTDRAEARRKYRAYLMDQEGAAEADDSGNPTVAGARVARDPKFQPVIQPGQRMGLFAAAKAAYRTPHYMDDIRNIRSLVLHSRAVWPVLLVCLAGGAFSVYRLSSGAPSNDPILTAVFQFLFFPFPLLPPMVAGFLAPRSSWLAGIIAGLIASFTSVWVFAILIWVYGQPSVPVPGYTAVVTSSTLGSYATTLLSGSLAVGLMVSAGTAWYKRFLSLSSGGGKRPQARTGSQREAQRRRPASRG